VALVPEAPPLAAELLNEFADAALVAVVVALEAVPPKSAISLTNAEFKADRALEIRFAGVPAVVDVALTTWLLLKSLISAANSAAIPCLPYAAVRLAIGLADALAVGPAGAAAAGAAVTVPELFGVVVGAVAVPVVIAGVVAAVAVPVVIAGVVAAVAAACVSRPSSSPWPCSCPCPSWAREPPAWRSAANKSCKNACKSAPSEFAEVPLEEDPGLDEVELDVPVPVVVIGVEAAVAVEVALVAAEVALDAFVVAAAAAEFSVTN
jgi:hypothetical protein